MTDCHAGYIVVLDEDIREDDAEHIINAIGMIKHVASVQPVMSSYDTHVAESRRDREWQSALWELAKNGPEGAPDE